MAVIKVIYNGTARRFTVSEVISWDQFVQKLRALFSLPAEQSFHVHYTDEDGDVITLSTDVELRDLLAQSANGVKLVLSTSQDPASWVLEPTPSEREGSVAPVDEGIANMNLEDVVEPYDVGQADGKEKEIIEEKPEDMGMDQATDKAEETENPPPYPDLRGHLQNLVQQFTEVLANNPQLIETASGLIQQVTESLPLDIEVFARWPNQTNSTEEDSSTNDERPVMEVKVSRPRGFGCPRGNLAHPYRFGRGTGHFAGPWTRGGCAGAWRGRCGGGKCGSGDEESAPRSGPRFARGGFSRCCRSRPDEPLSDESIKEKLASLQSMGFVHPEAEDLLKRYNGNVERVVEVLLQRGDEPENTEWKF